MLNQPECGKSSTPEVDHLTLKTKCKQLDSSILPTDHLVLRNNIVQAGSLPWQVRFSFKKIIFLF